MSNRFIMKICVECEEKKHLCEFYKAESTLDGLCGKCKSCISDYYKSRKKVIIASQKKYQAENRDKVLARKKAYRDSHREEIRIARKELKIRKLKESLK